MLQARPLPEVLSNYKTKIMKNIISLFLIISSTALNGQGFNINPVNWNCPAGGNITGGVTNGYNFTGGVAQPTDNTGSQSWSLADLTGDGYPDLVVTGQLQNGNVTSFSPSSNQYWKVYTGTGSGFSGSAINWSCPSGGLIQGGISYGFNGIAGVALSSHNTGSQSWSIADFNNDQKPDLVITAQLQGGNVTSFSPASGQYWKVFYNNGSGFNNTQVNWTLPNGGKISGGVTFGFNGLAGIASDTDDSGSQSWSVTDLNGDSQIDLIVTAQLQGGNVTSFSPASGQYWKVYLSSGSGFSMSSLTWSCPSGGTIESGVTRGFMQLSGMATDNHNSGSQSWSTLDLNNDLRPDLVVTGQHQGGHITSFSPTSGQYWKVYLNNGGSFNNTSLTWSCPNGGKISGGVTYGYNFISGTAVPGDGSGSQTWSVMDLNADQLPDLVVAGQMQGGNVTSFSPSGGQYWKIFPGNGTGFSSSATNWNCPNGGSLNGGITYGFNSIAGIASTTHNSGSQSWSVNDLNGDHKIDLIVCAQLQGGNVTSFSPTSNQYWKIYLNTSTTGIPAEADAPNVSVAYPNPSTGKVYIDIAEHHHVAEVNLINSIGQKVPANIQVTSTGLSIDVSLLAKGMYFVSLKFQSGNSSSVKFNRD